MPLVEVVADLREQRSRISGSQRLSGSVAQLLGARASVAAATAGAQAKLAKAVLLTSLPLRVVNIKNKVLEKLDNRDN